MTTTINHKVRLELELSCDQYVLMDCIASFKGKNITRKEIYSKIGFDENDLASVYRSLKGGGLLEQKDGNIYVTNTWLQYFKKKESFIPPIEKDVIDYFKDNGYSESAGKKAYMYYNAAEWTDATGKKIKSWKQKMIGVWFKEENKAPKIVDATPECPYTKQQLYEAQHYYESDGILPSWFDKQYLSLIK